MPPPNIVQKYPHSCQIVINDHVENEQEDPKVPPQQLEKNQIHQREDECHEYCLPSLKYETPQTNLQCLSSSHPNELYLEDDVFPIVLKHN